MVSFVSSWFCSELPALVAEWKLRCKGLKNAQEPYYSTTIQSAADFQLLRQVCQLPTESRALNTKYFSLGQHEGKTRNVNLSELQNCRQGQDIPTQIIVFIELEIEIRSLWSVTFSVKWYALFFGSISLHLSEGLFVGKLMHRIFQK